MLKKSIMAQEEQKELAIKSLYGLCKENLTLTVELCGNIIETISQCYHTATEDSSVEEKFLVNELASFVKGIKAEASKAERHNQGV